MTTFLTGWIAGASITIVALIGTEMLVWSIRPPEWRLWMQQHLANSSKDRHWLPGALLILVTWPILVVLLAIALSKGRSFGEDKLLKTEEDEKTDEHPSRLDRWIGPLGRMWTDGDDEGVHAKFYISEFRSGSMMTHLLIRHPTSDEWGAFRIDPFKEHTELTEPLWTSPDPTILQLVCERDTDWLDHCRP